MWWAFVCWSGIGLGLAQSLVQFSDLAYQRIDLLPLRRDGLVQRLDSFILIHQPRFERIDAVAKLLLTHQAGAPLHAREGRGQGQRARRKQSSRRANGFPPPVSVPDISGSRP